MTGWAVSLALRGAGLAPGSAGRPRQARADGFDPLMAPGPPGSPTLEVQEWRAAERTRTASPPPHPAKAGPARPAGPRPVAAGPADHPDPAEDDVDPAPPDLPSPDPVHASEPNPVVEPPFRPPPPRDGKPPEPAAARPVHARGEMPAVGERLVDSQGPSTTEFSDRPLPATATGPTAADLPPTAGTAAVPARPVALPPAHFPTPGAGTPRSIPLPTRPGDGADPLDTTGASSPPARPEVTTAPRPHAALSGPRNRVPGSHSGPTVSILAPVVHSVRRENRLPEPPKANSRDNSDLPPRPVGSALLHPTIVDSDTPQLGRPARPHSPTQSGNPSPAPPTLGDFGGRHPATARDPASSISVRIGTVEVRAAPANPPTPTGPQPPAGFGEYRSMRGYGAWRLDGAADA
jgi:hypothetical protein